MIVRAMESNGVDRLVAISAAGVGNSYASLTSPVRRFLKMGHIKTAYADLESMEQVFAESELDTLVVRPVTLTNLPIRRKARIIRRYGLLSCVSRHAVAHWIVDALQRPGPFEDRSEIIG